MLQLTDIRKSYTTGDFTQVALDDVSIAFRDNEFVAVLGTSGSGKTTMLNIVGGLDHYDSGDLVIDGVSTKEYRDRDWDTYRNNRIGFVFQSYNLIPHQSVLANVELALTLAGVSRTERRNRALAALTEVGLEQHVHKRPNQLSGGQMQRVAIARALVNDPEILLADEPTGALDTATSVQIMALLTAIAKDRLVVMVTHNPELAEAHATRIVQLSDGVVVADSDPFQPDAALEDTGHRAKRTSMSFLTALALSFNNLMTKKGRTLMTSFAGSIGIIGIAAILALANGVNSYIKNVEEETLSMYPLTIQSQGLDMTSFLAGGAGGQDEEEAEGSAGNGTKPVRERKLLGTMFNSVGTNDLATLKEFLDDDGGGISRYTNAVEYAYDVTPQIFSADTSDGVRQLNPDTTFSSMGLAADPTSGNALTSSFGTNAFSQLMGDLTLVESQFDVVAGEWPEGADEAVVVLSPGGGISDFLLYAMGLRDPAELDRMVEDMVNEEEVEVPEERLTFDYDELMDVSFKVVDATDYYVRDETFDVWTDKSGDAAHLRSLVAAGEDLDIVGVVAPKEDASTVALASGIYYTPALTMEIAERAAGTGIVRDQLAEPSVNVFTGNTFASDQDRDPMADLDLAELITIDEEAIAAAFTVDESKLQLDLSGLDITMPEIEVDPSLLPPIDLDAVVAGIDLSEVIRVPELPEAELQPLLAATPALLTGYLEFAQQAGVDPADVEANLPIFLASEPGQEIVAQAQESLGDNAELPLLLVSGYLTHAEANGLDPADVATNLPLFLASPEGLAALAQAEDALAVGTEPMTQLVDEYLAFALANGLDPTDVTANLPAFLASPQAQAGLGELVDFSPVEQQLQAALGGYMQQVMGVYMEEIGGQIATALESQLTSAMQDTMGQLATALPEAMSIDEDAFAEAFSFNMDPEELTQLLVSMSTTRAGSADGNLRRLGYADFAEPSRIDIYPVDFESKGHITDILNAYNDEHRAAGHEEQVIAWTDLVGTLMSSVTDIVNMVSYVLIAFVAISLVVSSIMIGVITYISVLERRKEIGILRSIGASKGDIGRVFNAETVIVGFVAGLLGILITLALTVPANAIVLANFDVANVAVLPWQGAVVLVFISVLLTFLAGLIPSSAASRKDPVEALRSE
ncbi:hypothetical protein GCM10028820_17380 [Tessaracoccus terricola]